MIPQIFSSTMDLSLFDSRAKHLVILGLSLAYSPGPPNSTLPPEELVLPCHKHGPPPVSSEDASSEPQPCTKQVQHLPYPQSTKTPNGLPNGLLTLPQPHIFPEQSLSHSSSQLPGPQEALIHCTFPAVTTAAIFLNPCPALLTHTPKSDCQDL